MKYHRLFVILLVFVYVHGYAQSPKDLGKTPIVTATALKIGEQMPDIPLGTVVNNYTGKTRFSQFIGKLVILDFWDTYCASCLAGMSHMENLQKKFKDSIQIFLVNPWETQAQIEERLKILKRNDPDWKFTFPNLPSIVAAKELYTLFPVMAAPHHVWIDPKGEIRLRGAPYNSNEEKIRDLLAGKEISSMSDLNIRAGFDKNKPYYELLGRSKTPLLKFGSYFSLYNNDYASYGGKVENAVDSAMGTIRNSFVNYDILGLYTSVFENSLKRTTDKVFYCTNGYGVLWPYCLFFVGDTLRYTCNFLMLQRSGFEITDKQYLKSHICYEQINQSNFSKENILNYRLEDLDRYFGNLYGTQAKMENRMAPCYILIRTSDQDKLSTKNKGSGYKIAKFVKNGKKMVRTTNGSLTVAIMESLAGAFERKETGHPTLYFLDETNFKRNVDIVLPDREEVNSIEDLRKSLNLYGLDIIKAERELEMLVIRDRDYPAS